jgi:hypothetical protein
LHWAARPKIANLRRSAVQHTPARLWTKGDLLVQWEGHSVLRKS